MVTGFREDVLTVCCGGGGPYNFNESVACGGDGMRGPVGVAVLRRRPLDGGGVSPRRGWMAEQHKLLSHCPTAHDETS